MVLTERRLRRLLVILNSVKYATDCTLNTRNVSTNARFRKWCMNRFDHTRKTPCKEWVQDQLVISQRMLRRWPSVPWLGNKNKIKRLKKHSNRRVRLAILSAHSSQSLSQTKRILLTTVSWTREQLSSSSVVWRLPSVLVKSQSLSLSIGSQVVPDWLSLLIDRNHNSSHIPCN